MRWTPIATVSSVQSNERELRIPAVFRTGTAHMEAKGRILVMVFETVFRVTTTTDVSLAIFAS